MGEVLNDTRNARVTRVVNLVYDIFGTVEDESGVAHFFNVSKVRDYSGQTIREIGLFPRLNVEIDVDPEGRVMQMRFPFRDRYRRILGWKLPFQDLLDSLIGV